MNYTKKLSIAASILLCVPTLAWAKNFQDKVEEKLEQLSEELKKKGEDIQAYLDNYHWQGLIESKATAGPVTLSNLKLNGHNLAVSAKPGDRVDGEVTCFLDPNQISYLTFYRVVVGIKGVGPQATIANCLGSSAGESLQKFTLIAPKKAGLYQIRFRPAERWTETDAFADWVDAKGQEPNAKTTVGLILVKP